MTWFLGARIKIGNLVASLLVASPSLPHLQMLTGCKVVKEYQLYGVDTVARIPSGLK